MYRHPSGEKWQRRSSPGPLRKHMFNRRKVLCVVSALCLLAFWQGHSGPWSSHAQSDKLTPITTDSYRDGRPHSGPSQAEQHAPDPSIQNPAFEQETVQDTVKPSGNEIIQQLHDAEADMPEVSLPVSPVLSSTSTQTNTGGTVPLAVDFSISASATPSATVDTSTAQPILPESQEYISHSPEPDAELPTPSEKPVPGSLSSILPGTTSSPFNLPIPPPVVAEAEASAPYKFPDFLEYLALDEQAEGLPDLLHIPFEDAVRDEVLEGWEDEWFTHARFNAERWGKLQEPKIDFVYNWVNGSEKAFIETMEPFEANSTLNDPDGDWIASHGVNRYRDWDELRYSIRSVEKYAGSFRNKIQLLVNAVNRSNDERFGRMDKQRPTWLNDDASTNEVVDILSQEDFFGKNERKCLPTFNSLTIENQIFNTPSDVDRLFALSDDMLLGRPHAASDIYSPLFGPTMGFKANGYNTLSPPTETDARRFGEKPYLIYTSWMMNRRFGNRKRKGQVHFGHSLSRSVTREAIYSFPRPALKSACQKFRGETGFQLYSWYAAFHYTIERHREALLWSYVMIRSDLDGNGNLGWKERQVLMTDIEQGMDQEGKTSARKRMFYSVGSSLESAGLEAPKVNVDTLWTSLDGPAMIKDIECYEFDVNQCLAPGFSSSSSDQRYKNPVFSTAAIFDRVSRQDPKCGDCLIKLLLNRKEVGLSPVLPKKKTHPKERETVLKALKRYQYTIVEPDALFVMVTDAEQVQNTLVNRFVNGDRQIGQLCLNDDVASDDTHELQALQKTMKKLFNGLWAEPSPYER